MIEDYEPQYDQLSGCRGIMVALVFSIFLSGGMYIAYKIYEHRGSQPEPQTCRTEFHKETSCP